MSAGVQTVSRAAGAAAGAATSALRRDAELDAVNTETLLEARGLTHAFTREKALDGLSFALGAGEMLGLLGPNGCGKSTTLRVLTGLLVPDAGELHFCGERVAPGDRKLRRAMGVVFQSASLDGRLSVRENLELSATLQGLGGAKARACVADALAFAQLEARAKDRVSELSGGMKRRLELSRALLHDPSLLLLDEPTSGLDEPSFRRAWQRIGARRAQASVAGVSAGLSVILTTHRAEEAALCDRVAVLDRGRVVACDTPQALIDRVSGDVLTLEADEPGPLADEIRRRFALEVRVLGGKLLIERERGHELIPRLVEALPAGSVQSLSMHRPTLADVFVKLTGRSLAQDTPVSEPEAAEGGAPL